MCGWERLGTLFVNAKLFLLVVSLMLIRIQRVLVQISAEITKPLEDRKFDGVFTINTELSPMASASFDVGR